MENKKKKLTVNLQKQNKSDTEQIVLDENKQAVFCEVNEDKKYYTPEISELHIGYQCEVKNYKGIWENTKIKDDECSYWQIWIDKQEIRTKYLDSSDIISLGFEYIKCFDSYQNNNMSIWFNKFRNQERIVISFGEFSTLSFERKSINELKTIIKLLNVE